MALCKAPVIRGEFKLNLNILDRFSKKKPMKYQVSSKSVQWESSCSMRTDRHNEAHSRFSKFCKRA